MEGVDCSGLEGARCRMGGRIGVGRCVDGGD